MKNYKLCWMTFFSLPFLTIFANEHKFDFSEEKRPNILFFIVDQWRAETGYETEEMQQWLRKNLTFTTMLGEKGTIFHHHYANSNGCVPSRTCMHTSQYPNVTGVTQTDGAAKPANSPEMTWLPPFTTPTMGNYFEKAGYKTSLIGKWHVSNASIQFDDGSYLSPFDQTGKIIQRYVQFYKEKNVLKDFGYPHWVGNEPEGSSPLNSGSSTTPPAKGRDSQYVQFALERLNELKKTDDPWFQIVSFVNPHDISHYGIITTNNKAAGWDFPIDPTLPEKIFKPEFQLSLHESLQNNKPLIQRLYRDLYPVAFQPIGELDPYYRVYYTLQKTVDQYMQKVWDKLVKEGLDKNTVVVFTSDHGELLSAHGRMFQKWYQFYEEAWHVPLIIYAPQITNEHQDVYSLTSHIDLLPTYLDFAGANEEKIRLEFNKNFSLNMPLAGKSLVSLLKNPKKGGEREFYGYTEDNIFVGSNQISGLCQPYPTLPEPSAVEGLVTYLEGDLWKIAHTYDPFGHCGNIPGISFEIYNLTKDPMELNNLFDKAKYSQIQSLLQERLLHKSSIYRITPGEAKEQEGGE